MTGRPLFVWVLLLAGGTPAVGQTNAPGAASWFVPPPESPHGRTIDIRSADHLEQITVTAPRRSAPVLSDLDTPDISRPAQSDAGSPELTFMKGRPYCQSAYHDVGGQPATGMTAVLAAGTCD